MTRRESGRMGTQARRRKLADVVARDGSACWLCGDPVDFDASVHSHRGPSLDHYVPLGAGGTHDLLNLKLAHRGCNLQRDRDRNG